MQLPLTWDSQVAQFLLNYLNFIPVNIRTHFPLCFVKLQFCICFIPCIFVSFLFSLPFVLNLMFISLAVFLVRLSQNLDIVLLYYVDT